MEAKYVCETCNDTGFVHYIDTYIDIVPNPNRPEEPVQVPYSILIEAPCPDCAKGLDSDAEN